MGNIKVDKNKAWSGRGRERNEGREGERQKKRTCTLEQPKIEAASIFGYRAKNSSVPPITTFLPPSFLPPVTCLVFKKIDSFLLHNYLVWDKVIFEQETNFTICLRTDCTVWRLLFQTKPAAGDFTLLVRPLWLKGCQSVKSPAGVSSGAAWKSADNACGELVDPLQM